jgi:5-methylcytosine-specific restriction endonuclease McrA
MRLRQGFVRHDGMVFSQYYKYNGVEKEMWYSRDAFDKMLAKRNQRNINRQKQNREKFNAYLREWRSRNPEKARSVSRDSSRKWRENNPESAKVKSTISYFKRKAIKKNQLHPNHDKTKEITLVKISKILNLEIDHIIPLSRGGFHWHENLRLLPRSLNAMKNNRLDEELCKKDRDQILFWDNLTKAIVCSFSIDLYCK